jgi:hypothetical protein
VSAPSKRTQIIYCGGLHILRRFDWNLDLDSSFTMKEAREQQERLYLNPDLGVKMILDNNQK